MWALALFTLLQALVSCEALNQAQLDNFAQTLKVKWKVKDNLEFENTFFVEITLANDGLYTLSKTGDWSIYLTCIMKIASDDIPRPGEVILEGQGVKVTHIQGSLFRIDPTNTFLDLPRYRSRKIKLQIQYWQVSRTDSMPNWYFTAPGLSPKVIESTVGEELSFVEDLTEPNQVKRYSYDRYSPYTVQERYRRNHVDNMYDDGEVRVIPKPLSMEVDNSSIVTIDTQTWRLSATNDLTNEATYLTHSDCYELVNGRAVYGGKEHHTVSGRLCERWDSQPHHVHIYGYDSYFETLNDVANYCRDPDSSKFVWCYTTDGKDASCNLARVYQVQVVEGV